MVDVRKKVAEITPEITQIREYIHENPELSMQEYNTCALLEDLMEAGPLKAAPSLSFLGLAVMDELCARHIDTPVVH